MAKTRMVKFLVEEEQYQRIKANALAKGHTTISGYLREISLGAFFEIEAMLRDVHKVVMNNERG